MLDSLGVSSIVIVVIVVIVVVVVVFGVETENL